MWLICSSDSVCDDSVFAGAIFIPQTFVLNCCYFIVFVICVLQIPITVLLACPSIINMLR